MLSQDSKAEVICQRGISAGFMRLGVKYTHAVVLNPANITVSLQPHDASQFGSVRSA